jgi:hypothetical protein
MNATEPMSADVTQKFCPATCPVIASGVDLALLSEEFQEEVDFL